MSNPGPRPSETPKEYAQRLIRMWKRVPLKESLKRNRKSPIRREIAKQMRRAGRLNHPRVRAQPKVPALKASLSNLTEAHFVRMQTLFNKLYFGGRLFAWMNRHSRSFPPLPRTIARFDDPSPAQPLGRLVPERNALEITGAVTFWDPDTSALVDNIRIGSRLKALIVVYEHLFGAWLADHLVRGKSELVRSALLGVVFGHLTDKAASWMGVADARPRTIPEAARSEWLSVTDYLGPPSYREPVPALRKRSGSGHPPPTLPPLAKKNARFVDVRTKPAKRDKKRPRKKRTTGEGLYRNMPPHVWDQLQPLLVDLARPKLTR